MWGFKKLAIVRFATVQLECNINNWRENLLTAEKLLEKCRDQEAGIALLPELFNTGFLIGEKLTHISLEAYGLTLKTLARLSQRLNIFIVAGIPLPQNDKPINGAVLFRPDGSQKSGGKLHLCRMGSDEVKYSKAATESLSFDYKGSKIGVLICYDIAFPESARILALEGIKVICVLAAWNKSERSYVYEMSTLSRALENGVWVITSNQTGGSGVEQFFGRSRFVTPKGQILAEMNQEQGLLVRDVDLNYSDKLLEQGETYPFLTDRKPEIYGRLCDH